MKKIINNISMLAIILIVVFTGCSKEFTDKKPSDAIAISTALSTEANLSGIVRDFKRHTSKTIIEAVETQNESRREWLMMIFKYHAKSCSERSRI